MKRYAMKFLAVSILSIMSISTSAGVSMQWQKDLSSYGISNLFGVLRLPNESVLVGDYDYDTSTFKLLVFDVDGTNRLVDSFTASWMEMGFVASNPDHFAAFISDTTNHIRLYELEGDEYVHTVSIPSEGGNGDSRMSSINSDVFYVVDGMMLKQYRMDSPPSQLSGAMASGIEGSNYIIHWDSEAGLNYQIQSSPNLTNWVDVGVPIVGTGVSLSWANALTNSKSFYRIIKQ